MTFMASISVFSRPPFYIAAQIPMDYFNSQSLVTVSGATCSIFPIRLASIVVASPVCLLFNFSNSMPQFLHTLISF